ncbi:MFS transporter [Labrenzia sp. 011]|uniref:MFS transporter n=1 Tax=Labrenzia sp. 011 TaxID=2171494 RepID=UPI0014037DC7|nr:MFS transporter [Labrenzia sp. 011]
MAFAAGAVVANNYYNQPLLQEMSESLDISAQAASWIASITQIGYALGLLLLLPLGDRLDRRHMITVLMFLSALMLVLFSLSNSYPSVLASGFLIGLTSIVPQMLPPIASQSVPANEAADAVGKVMAGLLLGIVLSRFVGGWLGDLLGWRAVYGLAAGLMLILMVVLRKSLSPVAPTFRGSYYQLILSLKHIYMRHATLRTISLAAALQFGAFSLFWTTLAFHLNAMPEHYSAKVAGTFALIGATGVLGALVSGKFTKRYSERLVLIISGSLMLAAFAMFFLAQDTLVWLIPAVILLDLGMQMSHVTSMSTILFLDRNSTNRLNTTYMVIRFLGGAVGTIVGGYSWHHGGWITVCAAGFSFCLIALLINAYGSTSADA